MAETIRGINVVIGSDTTGLAKALSDVNKHARDIQSELKQVEKLLKLDPTNTELIAQKQKLLADAVATTSAKLKVLKEAQEQVNEQFKKGDITEGQYRAFQREVAATEQQLKKLESEISKQSSSWGNVAEKLNGVGKGFQSIGEKIGSIGKSMSAYVTAPIAAAGAAAVKMASDMAESINKVQVAFKDQAAGVEQWSGTTLKSFGIAKGSALDMAAKYGDMATSMGLNTQQAASMSEKIVGLAGDLSSFKNIKLDIADTALTSIFTGETESLKQLGIVMTQANLQEYALSQGITTRIQDMTQAEQTQLRYNYVMAMTVNAHGDFIRTQDGAANQMRIFGESMKEAGATIGANLLPYVTQIVQYINDLVQKFGSLSPEMQKTILVVAGLAAAIGPLMAVMGPIITVIGGIITGLGAMTGAMAAGATGVGILTTAFPVLGAAITVITGPIGIAIAAIAALIAIGVLLYEHWDEIKAYAEEVWDGIKDKITDICEDISDFVTDTWEDITDTFADAFDDIIDIVRDEWDIIKTVFDATLTTIKTILKAAWDVIKTIFEAAFLIIYDIVTGNWSDIGDVFSDATEKIRDIVDDAWEKIKTIWLNAFNKIESDAYDIFETIKTIFSNAWESLKTGTINAWNGIKTAIENAWDSIRTFFAKLPGEMLKLGKDIVQGMIDGITGMIGSLETAASNLIKRLVGKAKKDLDSSSPSGVFKSIGEDVTQGLADGITDSTDTAVSAASGLVSAIQTPFANLGSYFTGIATTSLEDLIAGIKSKIPEIAAAAQAAAEAAMIPWQDILDGVYGNLNPDGTYNTDTPAGMWQAAGGSIDEYTALYQEYLQKAQENGWGWFYIYYGDTYLYFDPAGTFLGASNNGNGPPSGYSEPDEDPGTGGVPTNGDNPDYYYSPGGGYQGPGYYGPFSTSPEWRFYSSEDGYNSGEGSSPPAYMQSGGITAREGLIYAHPQEAIIPLPKLLPMLTEALTGAVNILAGSSSQNSFMSNTVQVINQGTIVGSNGMQEFADIVSRRIAGRYGLSSGGAW